MAAISPLPSGWKRLKDQRIKDKLTRFYRHEDAWKDFPEAAIHEPPAFMYWRLVYNSAVADLEAGTNYEGEDEEGEKEEHNHEDKGGGGGDGDDSLVRHDNGAAAAEHDSDKAAAALPAAAQPARPRPYNYFISKTHRPFLFDFAEQLRTYEDGGDDSDEYVAAASNRASPVSNALGGGGGGGGRRGSPTTTSADDDKDGNDKDDGDEDDDEDDDDDEDEDDDWDLRERLKNTPHFTMEELLAFAEDCCISAKEVQSNPKLASFLEQQLLMPLPDGWTKFTNPDGKVHYYHEKKRLGMWVHPRGESIFERHTRVVARKTQVVIDNRLKARQTLALEKALDKTKNNTALADLLESNRLAQLEHSVVYSELTPEEEATSFYAKRFGEAPRFQLNARTIILNEMIHSETSDFNVTPAQVIQMALFFGIKTREEPWLLCVALCALLAPLPPFWRVMNDERKKDSDSSEPPQTASSSSLSLSRGGEQQPPRPKTSVKVRTIEFAINEHGSVQFIQKEESLSRLLFVRDLDRYTKHSQEAHPSDVYWRVAIKSLREAMAGKALTSDELDACAILPFYRSVAVDDVEDGAVDLELFYYNFVTGRAIFATDDGSFDIPPIVDLGLSSGDRHRRFGRKNEINSGGGGTVSSKGKRATVVNKGGAGAGAGAGGIYKFVTPPPHKVSVPNHVFFPPIFPAEKRRGGGGDEWSREMGNVLEAESYLLAGGDFQQQHHQRPRTRQALESADQQRVNPKNGHLYVGCSGIARTLQVKQSKGIFATGGTWEERALEAHTSEIHVSEHEYLKLFSNYAYKNEKPQKGE